MVNWKFKRNCTRKKEITKLFNNYIIFLHLFLYMPNWQTYGHNIYIKNALSSDKTSQKVSFLYRMQYSRNWRLSLYIYIYINWQIINRINVHQSDESSQKRIRPLSLNTRIGRNIPYCPLSHLDNIINKQVLDMTYW